MGFAVVTAPKFGLESVVAAAVRQPFHTSSKQRLYVIRSRALPLTVKAPTIIQRFKPVSGVARARLVFLGSLARILYSKNLTPARPKSRHRCQLVFAGLVIYHPCDQKVCAGEGLA